MQVRIYKPTKSTMQSGDFNGSWLLEFVESSSSKFKEQLMGRTSSSDMAGEVRIKFHSAEEAIRFAQKKNYDFEVIKPKERLLVKKSYASNFK